MRVAIISLVAQVFMESLITARVGRSGLVVQGLSRGV